MFTQLRIRGLGVIDDAVLELSPGLNVLTGETGAGKTMVVSGLGLLLGERADSGLVRSGADNGFVEGIVALPDGHPALERAAEAGADHDSGELVLARTVAATGRSRAHVGGRAAPVSLLAELGRDLVAVHGQADQWRLRQGDAHRDVLDDFAGPAVSGLRERVATLHARWRAVAEEHERLVTLTRERARDIDALTASLEEIEQVDPQPGEDAALRAEDERLAHADALRLSVAAALSALSGDVYAAEPPPNVTDLLGSARSALGQAAVHDERLDALGTRLHELAALTTDVSADLAAYLDDLDLDPARLAQVQERRATLSGLTRKYGETVDEVLAWSQQAAVRLDELVTADDRVAQLATEVGQLADRLGATADELTRARLSAAERFASQVTAELGHLAMGRARVEVHVQQRQGAHHTSAADTSVADTSVADTSVADTSVADTSVADTSRADIAVGSGSVPRPDGRRLRVSAHGADEVDIRLAANPGTEPRSVTRAASGGELSRVMLALEVVGAGHGGPPTFVFDEVDAGVGGAAALDIGARLATLGDKAQVIVVTHLAQVAAFADRHLVVHKADEGAVTTSSVTAVAGDARLRELSRMMGGDSASEAGLAHARDLLEQTAAARRAAHPAA